MSESLEVVLAEIASWRPEAIERFGALVTEFVDPTVLVPKAIEHRGCFLNEKALVNPHLDEWFEERFSDEQREYVLNHVHLWDVTWINSDGTYDEFVRTQLRQFLPVLAEFWRQQLARQTTLPIEVWTADEPEERGPTIGFGLKR